MRFFSEKKRHFFKMWFLMFRARVKAFPESYVYPFRYFFGAVNSMNTLQYCPSLSAYLKNFAVLKLEWSADLGRSRLL